MPFIQDLYPNSTQVALVGLEQTNDKTIRQYAIDNEFIITTKDADFYEMNILYGQPPKIIWLKMDNQSKATTIYTLLDNHASIEQALLLENKECLEILQLQLIKYPLLQFVIKSLYFSMLFCYRRSENDHELYSNTSISRHSKHTML